MSEASTDELAGNFPALVAALRDGIERGKQRGAQVSVSLRGKVLADGAVGTSHDEVRLTRDTLLPWRSAGKPLTAVCILRLIEAGRLTLETPVAEVIPLFGQTSRAVTVRHLLTHTAGLASVATGWPHTSWDESIERICRAGLRDGWTPGERAAYDPMGAWFLLGEIVRQIDGRPIEQFVRDVVMLPIGMSDSWLSLPTGMTAGYGDRIGWTYDVRMGREEPTSLHTAAYCESPSPGAGCRGPLRELRLFYEMLLAGGATASGDRLLRPETVALMTARQREGMYDETFQHTLDFGLGVIVNSQRYGAATVPYGYGDRASEATFGHGGAQSCTAFADPERQLVVALAVNGYLSEPQHQKRMRRLLAALYDDLEQGSLDG